MRPAPSCPVCNAPCLLLDTVDFNKSCEESRGLHLPLSGVPIYYANCTVCSFCFAPEFADWSLADFADRIYNDLYIHVDPDYLKTRPEGNAQHLISQFGDRAKQFKHLDYGGGSGLMSSKLREAGWNSSSYDPFVNTDVNIDKLGKFDFITAYEVFEHVPNVVSLIGNLQKLLAPNGVILFSTLLSDGEIKKNERLTWWYASPRNGHISLFSKASLQIIAEAAGYKTGSFNQGLHAFWTNVPAWASHLINA